MTRLITSDKLTKYCKFWQLVASGNNNWSCWHYVVKGTLPLYFEPLSSLCHTGRAKAKVGPGCLPKLTISPRCWCSNFFWGCMQSLPDSQNCGLCIRRECRERFPRHRLQGEPLIIDPGMHHGTCITHVSWCMSGSLTRGGGKSFPAFQAHVQHAICVSGIRGPCFRPVCLYCKLL